MNGDKKTAIISICAWFVFLAVSGFSFWGVYGKVSQYNSEMNAQLEAANVSSAFDFFKPKPKPISILVVGDIMLDRKVRNYSSASEVGSGYPFQKVTGFLKKYDVVDGNLEGNITETPSKTIDYRNKVLQFTFATSSARALADAGFTVLGLANNHTRDFGYAGYTSTQKYLDEAGVAFFGDYLNNENISRTVEVRGQKIAFVGFNEFAYKNFDKVIAEIQNLRGADIHEGGRPAFIIVVPHWGIEYKKTPSDFQVKWAHAFIDAGADMVIGGHPHVVQTEEVYNGKNIIYSLGNFVFDQDFSEETKNGVAVEIMLDPRKTSIYTYKLIPVHIEKGQPEFAELEPILD